MQEKNISIIGALVLDVLIYLDPIRIKQFGWRIADKFAINPGNVFTTALTVQNLGMPVNIMGWTGHDAISDLILSLVKRNGMESENVLRLDGCTTTIVIAIIDSKGRHSRIVLPGVLPLSSFSDKWINNVRESSVVFISGFACLELHPEVIYNLMKKASNARIVFDPQTAISKINKEVLSMVVKQTEILSINQDEMDFVRDTKILDLYKPKTIFIRQGKKGVLVLQNQDCKNYPAYKTDVKNSLGAGDCFNGAILFGLSIGLDSSEIANLGNLIASLKVGKFGTGNGVPTLEEISIHLKEQKLLNILKKLERIS